MDIRFWLSMHPRNFDCGKVIRLQLFVSPYVCLFMLDDAKCQTYYTSFDCGKVIRLQLFVSPYVCLFMLDDAKCQTYYTSCVSLLLDLCYAQLTAVKIGHPLKSIT